MIRIDKDRHINPDFIVSLEWERRDYAYGPGSSCLVISVQNGAKHRVQHQPERLDGTDAYKVEEAILNAIERKGGRE